MTLDSPGSTHNRLGAGIFPFNNDKSTSKAESWVLHIVSTIDSRQSWLVKKMIDLRKDLRSSTGLQSASIATTDHSYIPGSKYSRLCYSKDDECMPPPLQHFSSYRSTAALRSQRCIFNGVKGSSEICTLPLVLGARQVRAPFPTLNPTTLPT